MSSTTESVSTTRSATEMPTVHLERMDDGTIAVLTLDDPKRANAVSPQMGDALTQHVRSLINDTALRAVIIRGAGKDFSIGGHRDMLISLGDGTRSEKELHDFMLAFYNRWLPVLDLPVPVVVVLQGDCIGVAPVFACAADIAIADETLSLQVTFASLGFYPGMALPELLKRRVGPITRCACAPPTRPLPDERPNNWAWSISAWTRAPSNTRSRLLARSPPPHRPSSS